MAKPNRYARDARAERRSARDQAPLPTLASPSVSERVSHDLATWKPRSTPDFHLPMPAVPLDWHGRPKLAGYAGSIRQLTDITNSVTGLYKALGAKEEALQDAERTHQRRELMPLVKEADRIAMGEQLLRARGALATTEHMLERQRLREEQELVDEERTRELTDYDFKAELANRSRAVAKAEAEAAEMEAKAAQAGALARLNLDAAMAAAETEAWNQKTNRDEAQRRADEARARLDDDLAPPQRDLAPELAVALASQRHRQRIRKDADRLEQEILSRGKRDQSQLTEDELAELEDVRQARAVAERQFDTNGAGIVFPAPDGKGDEA